MRESFFLTCASQENYIPSLPSFFGRQNYERWGVRIYNWIVMVLWKTIDKHVIHYQEHVQHTLYLKCLQQASRGSSPMPAYKKRKLAPITNLRSWIKSKGSKKLQTENSNTENVGHHRSASNLTAHWEGDRYARHSRRFMDAYHHGLDGKQAAWASWKYCGQRSLPPTLMDDLLKAKI